MKPFEEKQCKQILKDLQTLSTKKVSENNSNFWRRISKIDEQSPINRFACRASIRISADMWMRLTEENPRIVFCNHPNPMQQEFPFRIDDLLAVAMSEQEQWSTYASGEPLQGPTAGNSEDEGWYSLGNLNDHRQPFKSGDFTTITMTVELDSQSIEFNAYNSKGASTLSGSINTYDYVDEDNSYDYKAEFEKMKKKMVPVTGDAAEYLDIISPVSLYGNRTDKEKPLSPSLLSKVLHPETVDPLSISAPDVYLICPHL